MKKILLLIILLFFTLVFVYFIPGGKNGFYNDISGKIVCISKENCLHESAHKYDQSQNWISKSDDWIDTVEMYRKFQFMLSRNMKDEMAWEIEFFPGVGAPRLPEYNIFTISFWQGGWGGYTELYAHLIECSDGNIDNIPPALRNFYDMNKINKTMKGLGY